MKVNLSVVNIKMFSHKILKIYLTEQAQLFFIGIFLFFISSENVFAHHSLNPHFDRSKKIELRDVEITEWKFVNPHAYVYFNVNDGQGESEKWRCESTAATMLKRVGWTSETLRVGDIVTINGYPGRRESNLCTLWACRIIASKHEILEVHNYESLL